MSNWYDKHEPKLSEADRLEIKELYTGHWCEVNYLARIFKVKTEYMRYFLDHNDAKRKANIRNRRWQDANPGATAKSTTSAGRRYYARNRDKINALQREYYHAYKAKASAKSKIYYQANKEKVLARRKKAYQAKKQAQA